MSINDARVTVREIHKLIEYLPDGRLNRRLNETAIHATLTGLQDLSFDTGKLKSHYKLNLTSNVTKAEN